MTSYSELVELFSSENIARWSMAELQEIGLSPASAQLLADVGLPVDVPLVFTTQVQGEPSLFSSYEFMLGGEPAKILIIGGPPGDAGTRFFLDVHDDIVGLFSFSATSPGSEVVNASLENFITFLCLYAECARKIVDAKPVERLKAIQELSSRLREQDHFAFDRNDGWWSVVLDHLRGDLRI
ncbi:SUKH-4 family immunity protein [Streptomyces sp. NPDC007901]|uniref:SUKH-4 family immunity protein n=1 Tax=Streptomyces sp. NPDC007901 TaxID=3364785 RepID=UPI0036E59BE6